MQAIILSGGFGTRMGQLTKNRPKVMLPVGNKPILHHLADLCVRHGIREIIFCLHYLPEAVIEYFSKVRLAVKISYSIEKKPLGGAGAVKLAEKLITGDNFIVLNGDVFTNVNLTAMAEFHYQSDAFGTVLVHQTDHPFDSDLVETDNSGRIIKFFRPQLNSEFTPLAKTGAHIFSRKILPLIPPLTNFSLEKELIPKLLLLGKKLYAYKEDCYSKDVGTPERLFKVRQDYDAGKIKL